MKTNLLCLFLFFLGLSAHAQYTYTIPLRREDGWQVASLKQDTIRLSQLMNQLHSKEHEIHSLLLVQSGQLILEDYYHGNQIDTQHDLRSATKSIISLLTGIAIDQGFIKDENEFVLKYLPDWQINKNLDERKEKITIRDLLIMSSGLDCNDWDKKSKGQEDRVYRQKDWVQYTLDLQQLYDPGDTATYCTMGTVLLAEVISVASGLSIQDFANKYLFEPMRITNVSWGHTQTNVDVPNTAKRLYMTPRDMAKIGQLILNGGKWNDKQLISESWVAQATSEQTKLGGMGYGYLWWNLPIRNEDRVYQTITATGNGGQYIIVVPELEAVVIFTGGAYNSEQDKLPFVILRDVLIPLLISHIK